MDHRPGAQRSFVRTSLLLSVALLFAAIAVPAASGSTEPLVPLGNYGIDRLASGQEALDRLEGNLSEVAGLNDMSPAGLRELLLHDSTAAVDNSGRLLYVDPAPTATSAPDDDVELLFPAEATFELNSRPGSPRTIFLDFDGHTIVGTAWHAAFGLSSTHVLPPFDTNGNPATFSASELATIQNVWARMAEDFAPFEVNVTTVDPGYAAINRSSAGDNNYGTRLVFTNPSAPFCPGDSCGGLAYVGVFNEIGSQHDYYQPALCFADALLHNAKYMAECGSHEVGHNLGLQHDGQFGLGYYEGHNRWAPIMGVGYEEPITQWSKGEYYGANQTQDDYAVMASNGLNPRTDDHGNATGSATEVVAISSTPGNIERPTDIDMFRFHAGGSGSATFAATPSAISPNLDIKMTLYASNGTSVLATSDPASVKQTSDIASGMNASITHTVTAGQIYYIRIEGTSIGNPMNNPPSGYTNYGSIGPYTLTLNAPPGDPAPQNDDFANSIQLTGNGGSVTGRNTAATGQGSEPGGSCFTDATVNSVWWHWTPTTSGPAVVDTFLSNFNTNLVVYTGGSLGSLSQVACNNDAAGGTQSQVSFTANAGTTYRIRVDGQGSATGQISLGYRVRTQSDSVGLVNPNSGEWFLRDPDNGRTTSFYFGVPGDIPFMGDWDGDGIATPGLYRQSTGLVYIRNANSTGAADRTWIFGNPGDIPIVGDWDNDGKDTVSVYRPSTGEVFIINTLPPEGGAPVADLSYFFGNPGDKPFAGDFNANGTDTVGLHRETTGLVYFRNTHTQGVAHAQFFYGDPGDYILAGKWIPSATADTVAIFRPSLGKFFLRFSNTQGLADREYFYGNGNLRPVYGYFGNLPGNSTPPPGTQ